ncbi:hypothetical protein, partial [Pedobacter steynii]
CTSFSYQIWVFNQLGTTSLGCFRIYRETLSRFSCAASLSFIFGWFGLTVQPGAGHSRRYL